MHNTYGHIECRELRVDLDERFVNPKESGFRDAGKAVRRKTGGELTQNLWILVFLCSGFFYTQRFYTARDEMV
jgi:hypothetical protein